MCIRDRTEETLPQAIKLAHGMAELNENYLRLQGRGVQLEEDAQEEHRVPVSYTHLYMIGRLYAALSYNVAAVKWYTKAAEQECPEAQYELGVC